MFTDLEIIFMNSLGLHLDFDNLSNNDYAEIESTVADKLEISGFDTSYKPNKIGILCESILDKLSNL